MRQTPIFAVRILVATLAATCALGAQAEVEPVDADMVVSTTATQPVQPSSSSSSETSQAARIAGQYEGWAGSYENAESLVSGLRTGSVISLESPGTTAAEIVTFSSPTRNMGWGNVTKALTLAKAELADMGITNPTPSQLEAALMGGDITVTQGGIADTTHLNGVLALRSRGMGWGAIAHQLDLKRAEMLKPARAASQTRIIKASQDSRTLKQARQAKPAAAGGRIQTRIVTATAASADSRIRTATGEAGNTSEPVMKQGRSYGSAHSTRPFTSRVVTATGAPMATYASYRVSGNGSMHGAGNFASRITTSSGGGVSATSGQGRGSALGHSLR